MFGDTMGKCPDSGVKKTLLSILKLLICHFGSQVPSLYLKWLLGGFDEIMNIKHWAYYLLYQFSSVA